MKNRKNRHKIICSLIESRRIASQNELASELRRIGIAVTQATLSRDLLALKVIRIADADKGHIYALAGQLTIT